MLLEQYSLDRYRRTAIGRLKKPPLNQLTQLAFTWDLIVYSERFAQLQRQTVLDRYMIISMKTRAKARVLSNETLISIQYVKCNSVGIIVEYGSTLALLAPKRNL